MNPLKYFKESLAELHRVTWPTKRTAIRSTIIVLVFTLIVSTLIALVDYGFTVGLKQLISNFF